MRCSWIEKNRSRNKIDWERTKNDVSGVVSLFAGNLIHTSWLGGVSLLGRLATVVVVVASGTWWRVLDLLLVLGTLTSIVTCLATLVAYTKNSAGCRVVRWSWLERSWRTRRHIGWPRGIVLPEHAIGNPNSALLGPRTGRAVITGMLPDFGGDVHV